MWVVILRSPAFAKVSKNVVGDVVNPILRQQPPPAVYNAPPNTIQERPHQYAPLHVDRSVQRWPQNPRTASDSHPPRNVTMQPFYPGADQDVQRSSTPQHEVRTSYGRTSSHGIRLRPVSDLRTPSYHHQSCVLTSPPQPMLTAVCSRLVSSTPSNPLALIV